MSSDSFRRAGSRASLAARDGARISDVAPQVDRIAPDATLITRRDLLLCAKHLFVAAIGRARAYMAGGLKSAS